LLPKHGIFVAYNLVQNILSGGSMGMLRKMNDILWFAGALAIIMITVTSGCATKQYVGEQIAPVADRVTKAESRMAQTEGQIVKLDERATAQEGKISKIEGDLNKVDAKAEKALANFSNLKFERRITLSTDMKEGANFAFNSSSLSKETEQKIDEFLNGVKGLENTVILVTGHTDDKGSEDVNYELGKRRADMVGRYLLTQKNLDPLKVVTASYGETAPVTDNKTRDGRAKNRRVEILVYRETINSTFAAAQPQK
jgi:outer membrane protein OmpA-like peptidoglycan-associated protein